MAVSRDEATWVFKTGMVRPLLVLISAISHSRIALCMENQELGFRTSNGMENAGEYAGMPGAISGEVGHGGPPLS
jgi:hypothetical protein